MSSSSASMSDRAAPLAPAPRYPLFDIMRGFSLILMILYHFCYDLTLYAGFPRAVMFHPFVNFLCFLFQCLFISISGATCAFSRSLSRRGLRILSAAAIVSIVTYLFDPSMFVRFGILHFLGVSSLLYLLVRPLSDRAPPFVWIILFALTYPVSQRTFSVHHLAALGFRDASFASADYFPLLPWFFCYLLGTWIGIQVKKGRVPSSLMSLRSPPLAWLGRHSLWVYLLHQPVLMGLTMLIVRLKG